MTNKWPKNKPRVSSKNYLKTKGSSVGEGWFLSSLVLVFTSTILPQVVITVVWSPAARATLLSATPTYTIRWPLTSSAFWPRGHTQEGEGQLRQHNIILII